MPDFRFPDRWLNDRRIMGLPPDEFKAFVSIGAWMVSNRTDGYIDAEDLEYVPRLKKVALTTLVNAGVMTSHDNGWVMIDYESTQTSKSEFERLDNARRADREKKARQRAAKKSPGDGPGDMSRGTIQARTGQARTGQVQAGEDNVVDWPTVKPGSGGRVA